jgi:hypothetical protein
MDYEPLFKLPTGTDDIESVFKTMRPNDPKYPGSTYAHHSDNSTTGYRAPSDMSGTPHEIQDRSYKTMYLDPKAVNAAAGWFRDENIATYAIPEVDEKGKPTGKLLINSAEDQKLNDKVSYKKDQPLTRVPYSKVPQVGLAPVEFGPSAASPRGSKGDAHWGNKITEVHPRPARLGAGSVNKSGDVPKMDLLPNPMMDPIKKMEAQIKGYSKHAKGGMIDKAITGGRKII